jgi:hypothetical protein
VPSPVYPVANSNLGNGNLRPETFDRTRRPCRHDLRVLPFVNLALMNDPADVDRVRQELVNVPPAEQSAPGRAASAINTATWAGENAVEQQPDKRSAEQRREAITPNIPVAAAGLRPWSVSQRDERWRR